MSIYSRKKKTNKIFLFIYSTREIKPNQTDIGRKVKLKTSFQRLPNIPNNNIINKRDSALNNSNINSLSSTNLNNNNVNLPTTTTTLSSSLSSSALKTNNSNYSTTNSNSNSAPIHHSSNLTGSSAGSLVPNRVASSNRSKDNQNIYSRGNTELMKRSLK